MKNLTARNRFYRISRLLMIGSWLVSIPVLAEQSGPNIVLLLADDLGFSDIGSYGSEISTPNLDALAREGVRFSNYHTAASCAPTRAMLMTGVTSHRAGVGNMPESIPASQQGQPGYLGVLGEDVRTIAERLGEAGYHTYMTGKWHLGKTPDALPSARGFERTLAMADTGADNWEQKPYIPAYNKANWYANGEETILPEDFYSSKTFVDRTIEFIEADRADNSPFFAYVAFQAVHIPVQAPASFTDKYRDVYLDGWHILRQRRYQGAIEAGVMPSGLPLTEMHTTDDWQELSEEERRYEAKTMAVYAGMIDAMDHHVGRLMDYLREIDEFDNTVFVFVSDNGPEPSDMLQPSRPAIGKAYFNWWLSNNGYNTDYKTLGEKHSYNMIGPSIASAAASPLSYYKFFSGEGGMRVPLIISGLGSPLDGGVSDALTYVTDLVPTLLSVAGVEVLEVEDVVSPEGKDLGRLLQGVTDRVRGPDEVIGYELGGNAALFQGDYKIVKNRGPVGDNAWHLYNLRLDPGEVKDLSLSDPDRLTAMMAAYKQFERDYNVLPVPEGYDQRQQVMLNVLRESALMLGSVAVIIVSLVLFFIFRLVRRKWSQT